MKIQLHRQLLRPTLLWAILFVLSATYAAQVETITIRASRMPASHKCLVILPEAYQKNGNRQFPTVYLLHGWSGNYKNWITKTTHIKKLADQFEMIIVCPDGNYNSWFLNSPVDDLSDYEFYIYKDVVRFIDQTYRTHKDRSKRGISGLSMGGYGALAIAIHNSHIFGAASSMSGGVDLRPFPNGWDIKQKVGKYRTHKKRWEDMAIINKLHLINATRLKLFIECGDSDFFLAVNRKLHHELEYMNIPHQYVERPGGHTWAYWRYAIAFHLLFFHQYFQSP